MNNFNDVSEPTLEEQWVSIGMNAATDDTQWPELTPEQEEEMDLKFTWS